MILDDWQIKVESYDNAANGTEYNVPYSSVFENRDNVLPVREQLTDDFLLRLVAFLESFDMTQCMGQDRSQLDNPNSFISRLKTELAAIIDTLETLRQIHPVDFNPTQSREQIEFCYSSLARKAHDGLDARNYTDPKRRTFAFDVGASKILHAILPYHFIILDRYAAFSLMSNYPDRLSYRRTYPIGHNVRKYLDAMIIARQEIALLFDDHVWYEGIAGVSPLRILDKCAWISGNN